MEKKMNLKGKGKEVVDENREEMMTQMKKDGLEFLSLCVLTLLHAIFSSPSSANGDDCYGSKETFVMNSKVFKDRSKEFFESLDSQNSRIRGYWSWATTAIQESILAKYLRTQTAGSLALTAQYGRRNLPELTSAGSQVPSSAALTHKGDLSTAVAPGVPPGIRTSTQLGVRKQ
ncbi:hypothetical protein M422DRAFT_275852 [Sphaerobolus stellatus SS14]|uniref:Uncharacterized protein n=1 Tax=Sphaerobolus stellatus (strain SS14) TaxID=990650 RepID=A0A0C9TNT0_SPHS4|nr:hypothetical protein M422DRAFT_275852 [Sphaerobolus stellatus SS14]